MRGLALGIVLVACGNNTAAPVDACAPAIVYLDRIGGSYDHGAVDDAAQNLSVLLDGPRVLPPWPYDDLAWHDLVSCIHDALAPFAITLTEIDPGAAPHIELVFTTAYWNDPSVTHVIPASCRPGHQIELVFGNAIATPTRACELAMGAFAEMTALLSPGDNCLDFTSPAMDCDIRSFLDREMQCVNESDQPSPCRCGGSTENTFLAVASRFPACP